MFSRIPGPGKSPKKKAVTSGGDEPTILKNISPTF
jgi:hypothetical protein